jgi:hypothetical protein
VIVAYLTVFVIGALGVVVALIAQTGRGGVASTNSHPRLHTDSAAYEKA